MPASATAGLEHLHRIKGDARHRKGRGAGRAGTQSSEFLCFWTPTKQSEEDEAKRKFQVEKILINYVIDVVKCSPL